MPDVLPAWALTFSRLALGLIFAASSLGKLRDFPAFERAITNFQILPRQLVRVSAYIFLAGELAVVALLLIGGRLLAPGLTLAILLLATFCVALLSVRVRRIRTPCHCFGSSRRPVTLFDVWRNVGFILCALLGIWSVSALSDTPMELSLGEIGLLGMMAAGFVALSVSLGEVIELFRTS